MKFKKTVIKDPNFPGKQYEDIYYISGIYKIVYYHECIDMNNRPAYAAYYKPNGWNAWGNHVDKSTPFYATLKEAKAACEKHAERTL